MNFKNLKDIIDYYQAPERIKENIDLVRVLIEAQQNVIETQNLLINSQKNISVLTKENASLKQSLLRKSEITEDLGVLWKKSDVTKTQPYCPVCSTEDWLIQLQKIWSKRDKMKSLWKCPKCSYNYNPWDHKEPSRSGSARYPARPLFRPDTRY